MNIFLTDISKSFGKKQVILPLSLTFESGKFTTLLGSSGCGKTTLLRMIAGLETPDTGEIRFDDTVVFSKKEGINLPPEKRNLSFVFQDFALWPHMTVYENVAFGLKAHKNKENMKEKVQAALEIVKLGDFGKRYPHELSGGQQQRVSFARAIVVEPKCILFDEPLSALDAQLREGMREEIKELTHKLKTTSIFVTHDQAEAMSMSDYIAVMNEGKIVQFDTPVAIYDHPATRFVGQFIGKSNWLSPSSMVRPEHISVNKEIANGHREICKVISSLYQGGHYDIVVQSEKGEWRITSKKDISAGSEVTLYFKNDKIITFENQE